MHEFHMVEKFNLKLQSKRRDIRVTNCEHLIYDRLSVSDNENSEITRLKSSIRKSILYYIFTNLFMIPSMRKR